MTKTGDTPDTDQDAAGRPRPRQKPPKTFVVNTSGTVLPEDTDEKDKPQKEGKSGDLARPKHYRNVVFALVGIMLATLAIIALARP